MSIALWLALTIFPISIFAAGLGQLNVASAIGEPLRAEIELLSVTPSEMASLKARIAPEAAYAAQGLERPSSHGDISVSIAKRKNGKQYLKLKSNQPIVEPFLDMLVEVEWETGRVLREYTALLDPPGYERDVSVAQVQSPTIKAISQDQAKAIAPIKEKTTSAPSTATQVPAEDYLTQKGDTLSKIARQMKPDGVSLDQMLIGLYEANPEAFSGKNMNRLKVGKILQPPTEEALNAITRKQATKEIKVQTADWNVYRNKLAGIVADSTPEASEIDGQSSSGEIKAATEDQSIPESAGPKDVVKLSTGDANSNEADMQAKITALQEEVSAREKGLQEAQERTAALEKQIEDMQKLLTLKSDAMLEAQQQSEQVAEAVTTEAITGAEPVEQVAEAVVAEPTAVTEPAAPVETPVAEVAAKPVAQPKPANVATESSFISSLLGSVSGLFEGLNVALIGGAAGLIGLLVAGWFYLRNKRNKSLADFEQGIMTSGGLKANTVFGNTSGASVDSGDTSFLTDFSQSTSNGMIDTHDVDPIAEAEVYMAYGRDAQAEEILKDAISKEPKRYELHLKLLEMYAASKDTTAFETVSGELYTTLGAEDPTWAKVAEIGIKLEPNNPLYQISASVGTGSTEDADAKLDSSDFSDSPLATEADLDFSLDADATANETPAVVDGPEETVAVASNEIKSNESELEVDESVLDVENVSEVLDTQDSALEFNLNASNDVPAEESASEVAAEADGSFKNTMPNLEFPTEEVESPVVSDELNLPDSADTLDAPTMPAIEMPGDLSLDMPETPDVAEVTSDSSAVVEAPVDDIASTGFEFDIKTLGEDTISLDVNESVAEPAESDQANVMDLSTLSLDVSEDANVAIEEESKVEVDEAPAVETEEASAEPESADVDTKLELVAAYIDMEDREGAKELLDEVLKEGGVNQRKRAEELLATLS
ncbi:MAG: FimV/HubP family polar landmark protein [Methylophilaceae bacterium]